MTEVYAHVPMWWLRAPQVGVLDCFLAMGQALVKYARVKAKLFTRRIGRAQPMEVVALVLECLFMLWLVCGSKFMAGAVLYSAANESWWTTIIVVLFVFHLIAVASGRPKYRSLAMQYATGLWIFQAVALAVRGFFFAHVMLMALIVGGVLTVRSLRGGSGVHGKPG